MHDSSSIDATRNTKHRRWVRFNGFVLDLETGRLVANGTTVPLPEQAFTVLRRLLRDPGEVVSRQELCQLLWPGGVAGDFDNKLNGVLRKLRSALADDADRPVYVETLPRRGYRFVAPVRFANQPPPQVGLMRQPRVLAASIGAALAVSALTSVVVVAMSGREPVPVPKLAVLPLQSASSGDSETALASGLTFEITHQLARIDPNALVVLAPNTAKALDSDAPDVPPVIPDYYIDGRVQHRDDSVHVTLRLTRSGSDEILWTGSYDRDFRHAPGMQRDIAKHVAGQLRVALVPGSDDTQDVPADAMDAFWRARFLWVTNQTEQIQQSIPVFERTIALAPNFANAYSGLADSYNALALRGAIPARRGFMHAQEAARTAISLDPKLADGHIALALSLYLGEWAWDDAESAIETALALSPGRSEPHSYLASLRSIHGLHGEAVDASRRAVQFDPLSPAVTADLGWYMYYAGRYDDALSHIEQTRTASSQTVGLDLLSTLVLYEMGDDDGAASSLRDMVSISYGARHASYIDSIVQTSGSRAAWHWLLGGVVEAAQENAPAPNYLHAIAAMVLGDTALAYSSLELAMEARAAWAPFIGVDPAFAGLRGDARFQSLMEEMDLQFAWQTPPPREIQ